MAYAMTKQGSLDNCVTYEFMCDTVEDMNAIENTYRTIGSIAIVLQGTSGLEVYISGSDKQWNSLSSIGGSAADGAAGLSIHICGQNEVSNGLPNISEPDETTIYLVSAGNESGNLYDEYIYVEGEWEKFGSGGSAIDLSAYALKANPVFTGTISMGRTTNSTIGNNSIAVGESVTASGVHSYAQGDHTEASGAYSHVNGKYNYVDNYNNLPRWAENTAYIIGDKVLYGSPLMTGYICNTNHTSTSSFQSSYWTSLQGVMNYAEIVGNGTANARSNARALDWDGNEYLKGELYIKCNKSSQQGQKVLSSKRDVCAIKKWRGLTSFDGEYVWTDGENIYYSYNSQQYILDKTTDTWIKKKWNGLSNFSAYQIWADGENTYHSYYNASYALDKTTSTWVQKSWDGAIKPTGAEIWHDGNDTYLVTQQSYRPYESMCYKLVNNSWEYIITWTFGSEGPIVHASDIWTDGIDIYWTTYTTDKLYKLNRSTFEWTEIQPYNISIRTNCIWHDKENTYYSNGQTHYILDKTNNIWVPITWDNWTPSFQGNQIWTDGTHIYYSYESTHYVLDRHEKVLVSDANTGEWLQTNIKDFMTNYLHIPQTPTADGTYILTASVTNGMSTYRWIKHVVNIPQDAILDESSSPLMDENENYLESDN